MTLIDRLRLVMNRHQVNSTQLAHKLGIQPSGVSHLLSGRNKPSLDFLQKLVAEFDDIDLNWLVAGTKFERSNAKETTPPITNVINPVVLHSDQNDTDVNLTKPSTSAQQVVESGMKTAVKDGKKIDRIVLFYSDGTFETYQPQTEH